MEGVVAVARPSGFTAFSGADGTLDIGIPCSDTLTIIAPGYLVWKGVPGKAETICLERDSAPPGVVITVTAEAPGALAAGPSSTTLEGRDLEVLSALGPPALQARVPSLMVREYGGALPVLSMSIRGSEASQVGWLAGRHSMQSPVNGLPSAFPDPALFGSMTFGRGGSSGMAGGALSGAVLLEPAMPSSPALFEAGIDSRGGGRLFSRLSPGGLLGLSASLRRTRGSGGSEGGTGALLATAGRGAVRAGLLVSSGTGDIEGPDWSTPAAGSRSFGAVDLWGEARAGGFDLAAGFGSSVMCYSSVAPVPAEDRHSSGLADFSVARTFGIGPAACSAGADMAWDRVASTASGIHGRLRAGLSAEASLSPGGVPLTAAVRVEQQPGGRTMAGARLGAAFPLLGDSVLSVSLTAARGFRRPTFNDLYWPADAFAEGNPGLVPETSREIEAVVSSMPCGLLSLELAGWLARDSDMISWQPCPDGRWRPGNTASVDRRGLEVSAAVRAGLLEVAGSLSLMEIEDATPGSVNAGCRLPYRPGITAGVTAGARAGDVEVAAAAGWTGRRYTNAANTAWLDPRLLVDLAADWDPDWAGGWGAGIRASNLLDTEYEESYGYQGRSRTVGIEMHWREES